MRIIHRGRGTGKTTDLIKECADNNGCLVCDSYFKARLFHQQSIDMGLRMRFPITFKEFLEKGFIRMP